MTRHRRLSAFSAGFAALALIVAACGGDDSGSDDNTTETSAASSETTAGGSTETTAGGSTETTAGGTEEVPEGGTLVIGAEQEGDCIDWISSCAGTSWTLLDGRFADDAARVRHREGRRRLGLRRRASC